MASASARNLAAPRTSADLPLRSRIPTSTGRAIGVDTVAISGCSVFLPLSRPCSAPSLAYPYTCRWVESRSTNTTWSAPGSRFTCWASAISDWRSTVVQLLHVPVGERPQERAHRRGGPHLVEHVPVAALAQPVDVLDRVRTRGHPRDQGHHLRVRVGARAVVRVHDRQVLQHQLRQPDLLGQRDHRNQPGITDQIRLVKRDIDRRSRHTVTASRRVHLDLGPMGPSDKNHSPRSEGTRGSCQPHQSQSVDPGSGNERYA